MPKVFRKGREHETGDGGSFRKYLFYAVGEVFLLVAGILIALQVNNWNENRNETQLARHYSESLISDLKNDITNLETTISRFEYERDIISAFSQRLSNSSATLDTLITIARDEFFLSMPPFVNYSLGTYQAMQANGHLHLLEFDVQEQFRNLFSLHELELYYRTGNMDILLGLVKDYVQEFTFEFGVIESGPLHQGIWDQVDGGKLASKFNALSTMKMVTLMVSIDFYNQILENTNELLTILEL